MILDRFSTTVDNDRYLERTADRLRSMTAALPAAAETDPAVIRERLRRRSRNAERRLGLGEAAT